ncbi:AraC-like DNA-binding protein [Paenibacillus taihuensis]|uniref:AraC-like DNA-binding protein n=1 Tax=Paenibacillus taihuensis TaxID=1156355 RepID=A0A3D9S441_9BACL|nr:AraC family transcriptional regulator [Paenibacillus taihuensis]REE87514.1 AraC-like DNA-binding protein [Paenibacillus taihuensis]
MRLILQNGSISPSYLVVYTVSGEGVLDYGGQSYKLGAGSLFFIDCMEYQHYRTLRSGHWEFAWVHFYGGASSHYYDLYAKKGDPLLRLQRESPVLGLLRSLIDVHEQTTPYTELLGAKLLTELVTELIVSAHIGDSTSSAVPAFISTTIREMERSYAERIRLDDWARGAAVSKYHFIREFKKHVGMSPNEYVIYLRIVRAKELLKYTGMPIATIAEEVGIDHVSQFINLFKAREGITPFAFRKKWNTH